MEKGIYPREKKAEFIYLAFKKKLISMTLDKFQNLTDLHTA